MLPRSLFSAGPGDSGLLDRSRVVGGDAHGMLAGGRGLVRVRGPLVRVEVSVRRGEGPGRTAELDGERQEVALAGAGRSSGEMPTPGRRPGSVPARTERRRKRSKPASVE